METEITERKIRKILMDAEYLKSESIRHSVIIREIMKLINELAKEQRK